MPKVETNNINIYGATIVGIASIKVHLFKGKFVFNKTTGDYVDAPALGAAGLTADHELTATAIPHTDNKIGYEITLPTTLPHGKHDLSYLENLTYKGGIRILKKASGEIIDITNKPGV